MTNDFDTATKYQYMKLWKKPPRTFTVTYQDVATLAIGAMLGATVAIVVQHCDKETQPATIKSQCVSCHSKKGMFTEYFRKHGSKTPEEMAEAVLATKSPRLAAAVAKVESNGNYKLRNTGYKRRHHGAFQVNPKDWGEVPKDAKGQAFQFEDIMEKLIVKQNNPKIKVALNRYGGELDVKEGKYAEKILKELQEVPK